MLRGKCSHDKFISPEVTHQFHQSPDSWVGGPILTLTSSELRPLVWFWTHQHFGHHWYKNRKLKNVPEKVWIHVLLIKYLINSKFLLFSISVGLKSLQNFEIFHMHDYIIWVPSIHFHHIVATVFCYNMCQSCLS